MSFGSITVWMVEETRKNYQVFGHTESSIDLNRISYKSKHSYIVNVVGDIGTRYTAEEAYLIARSLERGAASTFKYPVRIGTGYQTDESGN